MATPRPGDLDFGEVWRLGSLDQFAIVIRPYNETEIEEGLDASKQVWAIRFYLIDGRIQSIQLDSSFNTAVWSKAYPWPPRD